MTKKLLKLIQLRWHFLKYTFLWRLLSISFSFERLLTKSTKLSTNFRTKSTVAAFVLTAFGKPILILPCRPRWLKQVATFAVLGPPAIWRETLKVLRRIQGKIFWGAQVSFWRKKNRLSGTSAKRRLPKATLARSKPEREIALLPGDKSYVQFRHSWAVLHLLMYHSNIGSCCLAR